MRLQAHFLATDFAAPRVVAVWSSVAEFQALVIRFAANVLFPGTRWKALLLLRDLVDLKMVLLGKRLVPRGSLALCNFHTITTVCDATFSRIHFVDTFSLRLVFVMVRAMDVIARLIFSVDKFAVWSSLAILKVQDLIMISQHGLRGADWSKSRITQKPEKVNKVALLSGPSIVLDFWVTCFHFFYDPQFKTPVICKTWNIL